MQVICQVFGKYLPKYHLGSWCAHIYVYVCWCWWWWGLKCFDGKLSLLLSHWPKRRNQSLTVTISKYKWICCSLLIQFRITFNCFFISKLYTRIKSHRMIFIAGWMISCVFVYICANWNEIPVLLETDWWPFFLVSTKFYIRLQTLSYDFYCGTVHGSEMKNLIEWFLCVRTRINKILKGKKAHTWCKQSIMFAIATWIK